jgi:hypothetical protein
MDLQEALRLLKLQTPHAPGAGLTPEILRRHYLRLALRTHPDKNPGDASAGDRFVRLRVAYATVLQTLQLDASALQEQQHTAALLDLLLRALQGEAVEAQLAALGIHRPPAAFGLDYTLPVDGRIPPPADGLDGCCSLAEGPVDLQQAFAAAFADDGLTDEGDPLGGYAVTQQEIEANL